MLLLLKAFASGCSALTGVEAIANAVPEFRKPRARRAQHTEVGLGVILGLMLIGIAVLAEKYHTLPSKTTTTLAQLTAASLGHNFIFYAIQLITTVLLALAANTSFGGLPVLASLLATDNFLPHLFFLRAQRQVHRYGVVVLAIAAAILLVASRGDTQALVPLFAIGVFVGFTLSQAGMVRHWRERRSSGWQTRAIINGVGAVFTLAALAIELLSKFTEGAWLIVIVVPAPGADVLPGPHDLPADRQRRCRSARCRTAAAAQLDGRGAGRRHVDAGPGRDLGGAVAWATRSSR